MSESKILSSGEVAEIDRLISSGALQLPLRVEGWHRSLTDGGWLVRHDTGRTLATVEFVPVELETGRPALHGNAPARAIVALINSIPALIATVRHLLFENERLTKRLAEEVAKRVNVNIDQMDQSQKFTQREIEDRLVDDRLSDTRRGSYE